MGKKLLIALLACCALCGCQKKSSASDDELRQLAAGMLMVGFKGDSVTDDCDAARYVRDLGVRAIVLFDVDLTGDATIGSRNITSKPRLKAMTSQLRQWSARPLLIALDQEGGRVARLKPQYGFSPTISAERLGIIDCEDSTRYYSGIIASELASCGVNLNLAPVIDIKSDSCPVIGALNRSFGYDPSLVAKHAGWFIDEHHKQGVACVMKHFPGHGSSSGDTHYDLVDVTSTWSHDELEPFKAIIDSGMADAIMTAHIYNRNIDAYLPSTLSDRTINDLLRKQHSYDGVVITDDLYMEGIICEFGIEDALIKTINAGADLICVGNNISTGFEPDRPFLLVDMIVKAVKDGRIPVERLRQANRRVDLLAEKYDPDKRP